MNVATTKERLLQYLDLKGISQVDFLRLTGIKRGFLDADKLDRSVSDQFLSIIISTFVDINLLWLIMGEGEMLKNVDANVDLNVDPNSKNEEKTPRFQSYDTSDSAALQANETQITIRRLKTDYFDQEKQLIPLYEIEAAAGLSTLFSNQNAQVPLDLISVPNAPKCDGALTVRGDSMYPILKNGDIVCYKYIKDLNNIRYGEIYLLYIDDGDDQLLTVKYLQKSDISDDYIKLVSHNPNHQPKEELRSHICTLAIVKLWIRYNTIS